MKRGESATIRYSWKKLLLKVAITVPLLMIAIQCCYPPDHAVPYASIDTVDVGGMSRDNAVRAIDTAYNNATLSVRFGDAEEPYRSPSLEALGVSVDSDASVDNVMYSWWQRLIPSSMWWAHATIADQMPAVQLSSTMIEAYAEKELGESCKIDARNASVTVEDRTLQLVPAKDGGTCQLPEVVSKLHDADVALSHERTVHVPMKRVAPVVDDATAKKLADTVASRLSGGVDLTFHDKKVTLPEDTVRSWLEFKVQKGALVAQISPKKAADTLHKDPAQLVAQKASVVTITTKDFIEVKRSGGGDGRSINADATAKNIADYLMDNAETAPIATQTIPAEKKYIRHYSSTDTGLSALMKHYADTHKGVYGVSLIELSGDRRRASYNDNRAFTTASTYKVYVAYSTLRRVENKTFKWSDTISGGRNLEKCLDDMIVLSDNPCAEALVKKIGYNALHADVQALGLSGTSFIDTTSFKTTAGDLATFMASLETKQLPLSASSRDRLIGALKRNVHRQGIPAGTSGVVADKVGFLDAFLHDAAIVHGPKGTHVLTIMTDGSTWGNIAELTREIEKLRTS